MSWLKSPPPLPRGALKYLQIIFIPISISVTFETETFQALNILAIHDSGCAKNRYSNTSKTVGSNLSTGRERERERERERQKMCNIDIYEWVPMLPLIVLDDFAL
jgi:hypothetical protein